MVAGQLHGAGRDGSRPAPIKCVVWDLDNTLWDGVLLEGDRVSVRPGVIDVIKALDGRGILHSIASKNDHAAAMEVLSRSGIAEQFLATLAMVFTISRAREEDLLRAEELTVRTHQLNTTGYTYSYAELDALRQSEHHKLLVAGLSDEYGPYGTIGLALLEHGEKTWTIKLLLMSCRVMSRGVGAVLLNYLMQRAKEARMRLRAEFVPNDRNRMMLITLTFAGFREVERAGDLLVFESDLSAIQPTPSYVQVLSG